MKQYAQEALESMAVNAGVSFKPTEHSKDPARPCHDREGDRTHSAIITPQNEHNDKKAVVMKLASELNKSESKGAVEGLEMAIKTLESKLNASSKFLPSIHKNAKELVYAHSAMWKTLCGWNYYGSSYEFVEKEDRMVSCNKCQTAALGK